MFSMLTLCIKHIPNINQGYGIDTDLVSIPRYYILVSYRIQNYGIEPSLACTTVFLSNLCRPSDDHVITVSEDAVRRDLRRVNVRKAAGPA